MAATRDGPSDSEAGVTGRLAGPRRGRARGAEEIEWSKEMHHFYAPARTSLSKIDKLHAMCILWRASFISATIILCSLFSLSSAQEEQCQFADEISNNMSLTLGFCTSNGTRQLKYRIKPGTYNCRQLDQVTLTVPSSVETNSCSVSCPPGTVLAVPSWSTLETKDASQVYCERCPENTYSVGGGNLIQNWRTSTGSDQNIEVPIPFESDSEFS